MEFADICSNLCADSGLSMAAANNAPVGAGGVLLFPPPYSVDEYFHKYSGCLDAHLFANLPARFPLTVFIS